MITCENCGIDNEDGAELCSHPLSAKLVCRSCGAELKPHWLKCPKCKTPVAQENTVTKCANCGEDMEEGWDECPACGAKTGGAGASTGGTVEEHANVALEYLKNEDWDAAISEYTQAIALEPSESAYFYNRGNAYHDKGDFDSAIRDYTEAIRLNPNEAAYYKLSALTVVILSIL
jgi:tetratricopeptide (TPR) repeat protein